MVVGRGDQLVAVGRATASTTAKFRFTVEVVPGVNFFFIPSYRR